ncbi:MAG: aspartate aminotransferase family protein [Desulfobacterales bacterium]
MTPDEVKQAEKQYHLGAYKRPGFVLTHGAGVHLYDAAGKAYLDFVAGIAVNALGYGDPALAQAVRDHVDGLWHVSNLYYTEPQVQLARLLVEHTFADKVFFCNSGTEAIEGALKIARKWGHGTQGADCHRVIAMEGSFHGRSYGALSATGQSSLREGFEPMLPGFDFARFNDLQSVRDLIQPETCAILLEPVQGEGGIFPAEPGFLQGLRELCDTRNCLLILDEIQCGLGRTGKFCAHQHYGITPDLMALAKPLAGGLPMGSILMTDAVAEAIQPGNHGTTFGGGPLIASVAHHVVQRLLDPGLLAHVARQGAYLKDRLQNLKHHSSQIEEVRGLGLMVGVALTCDPAAVIEACAAKGLLICKTGGNAVRLLPPLIVQPEHIDKAVALLAQVLAERT